MSYQFPPDLAKLVHEQMSTRGYTSEDDVLRDALVALGQFAHDSGEIAEEYRQAVAAVNEGVADMEAGRMRPLREIRDESGGSGSSESQ